MELTHLPVTATGSEIAELLRVQPESVRKAKYRLKRKLGLETEVTLETALRGL